MCQDNTFNSYLSYLACNFPTIFAIIFSTLITVLAVYVTIKQSRKTAREKNSIDFETSYKTNADIRHAWKIIIPLMSQKTSSYLDTTTKQLSTEEYEAINLILNTWERVSNGIFHKIYDGKFLYKTYGSTVIYLYSRLYPFIKSRQSHNPRFYIQFTKLYISWKITRQLENNEKRDTELRKILKLLEKY